MDVDGPSYGVNLVQEHSRWDNVFQELHGKVTLEICAFGVCRDKIFEVSAADVIAWGIAVANLMGSQAVAKGIPVGIGGGDGPEGYTPTYSGPMPLVAEVADQSLVGIPPPAYAFDDSEVTD
jgi:hypothetical protein